jgi:hypothetical protein
MEPQPLTITINLEGSTRMSLNRLVTNSVKKKRIKSFLTAPLGGLGGSSFPFALLPTIYNGAISMTPQQQEIVDLAAISLAVLPVGGAARLLRRPWHGLCAGTIAGPASTGRSQIFLALERLIIFGSIKQIERGRLITGRGVKISGRIEAGDRRADSHAESQN